jgi:predicted RNA-binding Zn ribbon-like protein
LFWIIPVKPTGGYPVFVLSQVTGKPLPRLGGALCLDFVNTIDPRLKPPREEFLGSFEQLAEWARFVGVLTPAQRRLLVARTTPSAANAVLSRAIELREALYRLFRSPDITSTKALAVLNRELRRAGGSPALEHRKGRFQKRWPSIAAAEQLIGPIARSASALLTSPELQRVRECAGDGCGWLFIDTSRAHRRRWCSMAICGNRLKARRHRQRRVARR